MSPTAIFAVVGIVGFMLVLAGMAADEFISGSLGAAACIVGVIGVLVSSSSDPAAYRNDVKTTLLARYDVAASSTGDLPTEDGDSDKVMLLSADGKQRTCLVTAINRRDVTAICDGQELPRIARPVPTAVPTTTPGTTPSPAPTASTPAPSVPTATPAAIFQAQVGTLLDVTYGARALEPAQLPTAFGVMAPSVALATPAGTRSCDVLVKDPRTVYALCSGAELTHR